MGKVLIVEDDEVIGRGMAAHLDQAGFDPLLVPRGETGLARLRYERPDVVVLDLMLPEMDGWRLIETARAERRSTAAPARRDYIDTRHGVGYKLDALPRSAAADG